MSTGIRKLHSKGCPGRDGGRCRCGGGYEASVFSKRDGKKIRKTFAREAEARWWRTDALAALSKGAMRAPKPTTVREAWEDWYELAKAGTIRNRSGHVYKPAALRNYERAMRLRVLDDFGGVRLADLHQPDLQDFVHRMLGNGLDPSTISVTLLPLRAIFRRAVSRGDLMVDPCRGLAMPASRGHRDRIASPPEAAALIAAVPDADRAIWATAMYAGLRRGELLALHCEDINLAGGVIHVRRGWDAEEGEILVKSTAANRRVPIAAILRDVLVENRQWSGRSGPDLEFGRTPSVPFAHLPVQRRADKAWQAAELERITFHECRHTFASLMIAAGVNAKALSTYMGHANISITLDRYGHLMPGSEEQAARLLDAYFVSELDAAAEAARAAGAGPTGEPTGEQVANEADRPHR
jgi:integrase